MSDKQRTPSSAELVTTAEDGAKAADDGIDYSQYIVILEREREWRRLNPDLWCQIENYALNEALHQRQFAIKHILERVRWKDYADKQGNPVRVSNDFAPIWSRILVKKHPEIKPFIKLRPSIYDEARLGIGLSEVM